MVALVLLLLVVGFVANELNFANLFSTGAVPSDGYRSFGTLTSAGPWMLGFLLGAFTIVGFESAANLAEETKDPALVVPRAMWQAVSPLACSGSCSSSPSPWLAGDPVALAESARRSPM